jgi:S1-C subfamily serine protease
MKPVAIALIWSLLVVVQTPAEPVPILDALEREMGVIFDRVKRSVVTIRYRVGDEDDPQGHDLVATGIILDEDGYILTTKDFSGLPRRIRVWRYDGQGMDATLIGSDWRAGVCVLKVPQDELVPAEISGSEAVREGKWVLIVGNSYGVPCAVSLGMVSGRRPIEDLIQVSGSVNPGQSGAGVFDLNGELIGIVSASLSRPLFLSLRDLPESVVELWGPGGLHLPTSGSALVIPADRAVGIARRIITEGSPRYGWLGVYLQELTGHLKVALKVDAGALISGVVQGGPADKVGIKPQDVVIVFDGRPVRSAKELRDMVLEARPGKEVLVTMVRDGRRRTVKCTVTMRHEEARVVSRRDLSLIPPERTPSATDKELLRLRRELENLKREVERLTKEKSKI